MFNDRHGLTLAVLDGRKTQTRRIMKGKPIYPDDEIIEAGIVGNEVQIIANGGVSCITLKLPYKLGEVVAVAQSYEDCGYDPEEPLMEANGIGGYVKTRFAPGWGNKMFVRADACKNRIHITNVRVERLNDISESDCLAEGVEKVKECKDLYRVPIFHKSGKISYLTGNTLRETYAALIDKISGKGTWESNPYVFVYDFELVKE